MPLHSNLSLFSERLQLSVYSAEDAIFELRRKLSRSADDTNGVADGLGVAVGLADEALGGGGVAPFWPPPQLTASRRAARRNTERRAINTP